MSAAAPATPAAPPTVDLVNVQIDGVWHKFPKGTRMIEACKQAKAEVPHYCYHPKADFPRQLPHVPRRDGHAAASRARHRA
jgi:NADH-quinone oxidoreductase subunit G